MDFFDNIKVFAEVSDIGFIKKCISDYSVILVDYIELLEINKDELLELKELVKNENKTLIIISCCSGNKELMNNDHYNELKEIADLMILTDLSFIESERQSLSNYLMLNF